MPWGRGAFTRNAQERAKFKMTRKEEYRDYLQTDYWKLVSSEVKRRAGYRCQVCNGPDNLEAHHRTYEHRGSELEHLEDMICLCRKCHGLYHKPPEPPPRVITETVVAQKFVLRISKVEILNGISMRNEAAIKTLCAPSGYSFVFLRGLPTKHLIKLAIKYLP